MHRGSMRWLFVIHGLHGAARRGSHSHPTRRTDAFPLQIPPAERRGIPHHLLDVLEPLSEFSAGDFFVRARAAADDVLRVSWGVCACAAEAR